MQAMVRVRTRKKVEVVDLIAQIADMVARGAVDEGICTVFVRHATAAIVSSTGPGRPAVARDIARACRVLKRRAALGGGARQRVRYESTKGSQLLQLLLKYPHGLDRLLR